MGTCIKSRDTGGTKILANADLITVETYVHPSVCLSHRLSYIHVLITQLILKCCLKCVLSATADEPTYEVDVTGCTCTCDCPGMPPTPPLCCKFRICEILIYMQIINIVLIRFPLEDIYFMWTLCGMFPPR